MAFVLNQSSLVIGLVTLENLVEELVGKIQSEYQARDEQAFAQRVDGSWLVDGMVAYDSVWERIGIPFPAAKSLETLQPWLNSSLPIWDVIQR